MIIEVTLEEDTKRPETIVSLAGYIARNGRPARKFFTDEPSLVSISGCDVVNLAERRG